MLTTPPPLPIGEVLARLLRRSHLLKPGDLGLAIAEEAAGLGATEVVIRLLDYGQTQLVALPVVGGPDRKNVSVEGSLPGRSLRGYEIIEGDGLSAGTVRVYVPLVSGTDRLGVLELDYDAALCEPAGEGERRGELADEVRDAAATYAELVGMMLATKAAYGDLIETSRHYPAPSLATEIQRRTLPPLTFATESLVVAGMLAPWQAVAGDSFDYAVDGDLAHIAIFDGMGHGIDAALLVSVAVAAYRQARRQGLALDATFTAIDEAIKAHIGDERFVTALLAELRLSTGRLRWLSAGHPAPLLLRSGKVISRLELPVSPPLGLGHEAGGVHVGSESLEPSDRLLLYTDGVVEARKPDGEFFGVDRLANLVVRESASGAGAPEVLRRLGRAILEHQQGQLQDDATTLLIEWTGGGEHRLMT